MEATLNALRGGRDVLQGMSNAAAGAVSVPVDVLAWALRKAGVPVGDEPVGGSDWMKRKGLTREPENRVAGVIGESIGGVLPMVASAKAPQIAAGVNQMIDNAMAPRRMNPQAGAIVWHGSPHKFTRFDSSKIGTGEGAQAYGMGHYTAQAKDVADQYRINLSYDPEKMRVGGKQINQLYSQIEGAAARMPPAKSQAEYEKLDLLERLMMNNSLSDVRQAADAMSPATKSWFEKTVMPSFQTYGNLYKIDLPDEAIGRMLDWDKPLSQQAGNVRSAVEKLSGVRADKSKIAAFDDALLNALQGGSTSLPKQPIDPLGADLYSRVIGGGSSAAAQKLRDAGIPGIRYLDQGSRAAGQGTSNYVVFPGNEDLLKILEINDQPVQAVIDALRNKR